MIIQFSFIKNKKKKKNSIPLTNSHHLMKYITAATVEFPKRILFLLTMFC